MNFIIRENGQSFYIGDDIVVTIIKSNQGSVEICINAPISLTVMKTELLDGSFADIPLPQVEYDLDS